MNNRYTYKLFTVVIVLMLACSVYATPPISDYVKSGPMLGHVELRTANVWVEVFPSINRVVVQYWEQGDTSPRTDIVYTGALHQSHNPCQFTLVNLKPNTAYSYQFVISGEGDETALTKIYTFNTPALWQWQTPPPDFSFLAGSCAYINEKAYDRPGKPYGKDPIIFSTMAQEKASFMLWLGDNWYTREVDYGSPWGLEERASHTRAHPTMQPLLSNMSHYAIWDDHCYGVNNSNKSYIFKEESRKVFSHYWANPSYGQKGEGIYTAFSYSDVDFFLLDNRYFRSADNMHDSLDGRLNDKKRMLGSNQMEWLKNQLLASRASFKIIACGSQILSTTSPYESLFRFPLEYNELLDFLSSHKIDGVIFLSGDRHYSAVVKHQLEKGYTLFDITTSSLTAGSYRAEGKEKEDPNLVLSVDNTNNYSVLSVSGTRGSRELKVTFKNKKGYELNTWSVNQTELRYTATTKHY